MPYGEAAVYAQTETRGGVGGTVPATLSLTLGAPATFGAFTPGVDRTYEASHDRDGHEHRGRRGAHAPTGGTLTNGAFTLPSRCRSRSARPSWTGPVSNDPVDDHLQAAHRRHAAAAHRDLRKTLTFTLSTTTP